MSDRYYFTCPNCDAKIPLISEHLAEINAHGYVKCACGSAIRPDDPQYSSAKKQVRSQQLTTYCVYGGVVVLGLIALNLKAPAILPVLVLGAGALVRSQHSGEWIQLQGRLTAPDTTSAE